MTSNGCGGRSSASPLPPGTEVQIFRRLVRQAPADFRVTGSLVEAVGAFNPLTIDGLEGRPVALLDRCRQTFQGSEAERLQMFFHLGTGHPADAEKLHDLAQLVGCQLPVAAPGAVIQDPIAAPDLRHETPQPRLQLDQLIQAEFDVAAAAARVLAHAVPRPIRRLPESRGVWPGVRTSGTTNSPARRRSPRRRPRRSAGAPPRTGWGRG